MALFLRQSTASQEVPLGYFVDSTDGNTEETALSIANTDIKIWKTGATTLASKNSGGATHISNGVYYCVLDATDTNTIGPLVIFVHVSGALSVKVDCCVLDEAVYDALFGTTSLALVGSAMTLSSGAITAAVIATDAIDADAIADNAINAGAIATGAITAAKFAAGAIDAAALAADAGTEIGTAVWATTTRTLTAIDEDSTTLDLDATIRAAVGLAAADLDTQLAALPTAAENADAVWDEDATGHQTGGTFGQAIGDPVADTNTIYGAVVTGATGATIAADIVTIDGIVDNILVDTAEIGAAGAGLTALATQASVNTIDDFLDTEIAAIKAKTDSLTFSTANRVDAQVFGLEAGTVTATAVATGAIDADALAADAGTELADAFLDRSAGVETGLTPRQWFRLAASVLFGKASGMETTTAVFRDFADTKDRISATVDADGNRTAVTRDAT